MLKLAITLLAAALCSAPTAKAEDAPYEKQAQPSFSQSVKRAYYDPEETYGTTVGTFYNYSQNTIKLRLASSAVATSIGPNQTYQATQAIFTIDIITGDQRAQMWTNGENPEIITSSTGYVEHSTANYYWFFDRPYYQVNLTATNGVRVNGASQYGYWGDTANLGVNPTSLEDESTISFYIAYPQGTLISLIAPDLDWVLEDNTGGNYPTGYTSKKVTTSKMTYENREVTINGAQDPEEMNENIFEAVGDTIEGLSTALTSPWEGLLNIFYDTTEQELTPFGEFSLIVAGTTVVLFLFGLVITLFRQRK